MNELNTGAAEMPVAEHVHGKRRNILLGSLFVNFAVLFALYNGVINVLLPNQVALLDPAHKAANFSFIMFVTLLFTIVATPLAGALSDRVRSPLGRRSPFILFATMVGSAAVLCLILMKTVAAIAVCMVVMSFAYNMMQGPMTTIVADRLDEANRGKGSGFVGAAQTAGGMGGIILAGYLANRLFTGYAVFALAIVATSLLFVVFNREKSSAHDHVEPFHLGRFFTGFWVNPKTYPDFGWAFIGRFLMYLGIQSVITLQLYILQDYIHLDVTASNHAMAILSVITAMTLVISGLISGYLSDLLKVYKYFVVFASLVMATALSIPIMIPTLTGMYIYAAVFGLGYAAFISIDLALITRVLPKRANSSARDMGVMTIANVVPQALSPILAVPLLKAFDNNYAVVFVAAMVCVLMSSLCILPIKSVK
ncbi:MFS transporter [Asticcacaulis benevestitus]|uniref:Major facilitator superfamily (MFS) profile domain-containing protein n=1 Tax=Asticcacaulis benevestitus DSM 16100 = ATCC BAA-896 TaxID=1121022 RepID=V4PD16_9CAUL|nr:MFS transporter [Asticcacaulis benevestitus]ESQ91822.1 hypothetical protein ABENE_09320 [Asticcacaulis benevestitus DSM 16100 = ATCC BAA-896]